MPYRAGYELGYRHGYVLAPLVENRSQDFATGLSHGFYSPRSYYDGCRIGLHDQDHSVDRTGNRGGVRVQRKRRYIDEHLVGLRRELFYKGRHVGFLEQHNCVVAAGARGDQANAALRGVLYHLVQGLLAGDNIHDTFGRTGLGHAPQGRGTEVHVDKENLVFPLGGCRPGQQPRNRRGTLAVQRTRNHDGFYFAADVDTGHGLPQFEILIGRGRGDPGCSDVPPPGPGSSRPEVLGSLQCFVSSAHDFLAPVPLAPLSPYSSSASSAITGTPRL